MGRECSTSNYCCRYSNSKGRERLRGRLERLGGRGEAGGEKGVKVGKERRG